MNIPSMRAVRILTASVFSIVPISQTQAGFNEIIAEFPGVARAYTQQFLAWQEQLRGIPAQRLAAPPQPPLVATPVRQDLRQPVPQPMGERPAAFVLPQFARVADDRAAAMALYNTLGTGTLLALDQNPHTYLFRLTIISGVQNDCLIGCINRAGNVNLTRNELLDILFARLDDQAIVEDLWLDTQAHAMDSTFVVQPGSPLNRLRGLLSQLGNIEATFEAQVRMRELTHVHAINIAITMLRGEIQAMRQEFVISFLNHLRAVEGAFNVPLPGFTQRQPGFLSAVARVLNMNVTIAQLDPQGQLVLRAALHMPGSTMDLHLLHNPAGEGHYDMLQYIGEIYGLHRGAPPAERQRLAVGVEPQPLITREEQRQRYLAMALNLGQPTQAPAVPLAPPPEIRPDVRGVAAPDVMRTIAEGERPGAPMPLILDSTRAPRPVDNGDEQRGNKRRREEGPDAPTHAPQVRRVIAPASPVQATRLFHVHTDRGRVAPQVRQERAHVVPPVVTPVRDQERAVPSSSRRRQRAALLAVVEQERSRIVPQNIRAVRHRAGHSQKSKR